MVCHIFRAKPLHQPVNLDSTEQDSVKFESKYVSRLFEKYIWKYRLRNGGHFAQASMYRKISDIRRTKSQILNAPGLGMHLSLRNVLKPSVKWRMKM